MFNAARLLGGMTCEARGGIEQERVFNPRWIWNFDASGGRTLGYEAKIKTLVGAAAPKMVGKSGLKQMYNHITAVHALGQIMPPLIGIRAKKGCTEIKKGQPVLIPLDTIALKGSFYGADIAPPLLVIYAHNDKACLTDLFLNKIVDPQRSRSCRREMLTTLSSVTGRRELGACRFACEAGLVGGTAANAIEACGKLYAHHASHGPASAASYNQRT